MSDNLNEIIENAKICDLRYGVKGMEIWLPYGMNIRNALDSVVREEMKRTDHGEVSFPLLIPEDYFKKEGEHIKGFSSQVYWVTHGGERKLIRRLLLRPTSETAMYPSFALWIRTHRDLPLKVFQIVNTYRYETKQTKPLLRVREIHFFESHTAHENYEGAEEQVMEDIEIMNRISQKLCLPFLLNKRPEWDKFAGAHYSLGADVSLPTGRVLQVGTIHNYRDNFSKAYEVVYKDEAGEEHFVHQTTYGMSERLLGAILLLHSDEIGPILPPAIAPIKAAIIPILFKGREKGVMEYAELVYESVKDIGVEIDRREMTPGNKYYEWERMGVPLRIEVGPKDMEKNSVVLVRRDNREKIFVSFDNIREEMEKALKNIESSLYNEANKLLKGNIVNIDDVNKKTSKKILRFSWCGSDDCGHIIEEKLDRPILGTGSEREMSTCVVCKKECDTIAYAAKTY